MEAPEATRMVGDEYLFGSKQQKMKLEMRTTHNNNKYAHEALAMLVMFV